MDLNNVLYFLFMGGLFFVMMRFGCGSHVMGHGHRLGTSDQTPGSVPISSGPAPGLEKKVDPVCGTPVDAAVAKTSAFQGQIYYFCSTSCREKFEATPAIYAKQMAGAAQQGGHHHGCC